MNLDKIVHIPDLGDVGPDSGFHVLSQTEDGRFAVGKNGVVEKLMNKGIAGFRLDVADELGFEGYRQSLDAVGAQYTPDF
ncbi:MAG: hypothetical protein J6W14_07485 [Clostridia bacterium]|nr:hypothetical protein [Clostridia bacterium]